ncbi:MAG TPA: CHC2 zinc finger domain-containing protein, partial [Bacteroidales bacterium]|nr:CHC2 zinc finger domain-containing protein [Bacteroidales bacterium]
MIDQATIDKIYDAIQIIDVVGDFVSLKRRGANYLGHCPFHNEKTPSFTVSASKGIYKCFGCGKGGNGVTF